MKLFAVHDAEGTIYEAVMSPDDSPDPVLQTESGLMFTEVDPPKDVGDDADLEAFLQDFVKSHRVEMSPRPRSRLVRLESVGD
jgi:hypothetical protein